MRILVIALTALVSACVSSPTAGRVGADATSSLRYGLARSYYLVQVVEKADETRVTGVDAAVANNVVVTTTATQHEDHLELVISGPFVEAERYATLDFQHSGFAADRFTIDHGPQQLLETITIQSDGRANEAAYNLGQLVGAGASLGKNAVIRQGGVVEVTALLFEARWRVGWPNAVNNLALQGVNDVIAAWPGCAATACPRVSLSSDAFGMPSCEGDACATETGLRQHLLAGTPEACARALCFSTPTRSSVEVTLRQGDGGPLQRRFVLDEPALDPQSPSYIEINHGSVGGGATQIGFADGEPTYVEYVRPSEVESTILIVPNFLRGVGDAVSEWIPFRFWVDQRRYELGDMRENPPADGKAPPAAPSLTPQTVADGPGAAAAIPTAAIEPRSTTTRRIRLATQPSYRETTIQRNTAGANPGERSERGAAEPQPKPDAIPAETQPANGQTTNTQRPR